MATQRTAQTNENKVWTIAEAKARLSEILRLAESEGPQRIGTRKSFVVVPEEMWLKQEEPPRMPMGQWLLEKMPRDMYPDEPYERGSERAPPFSDWTEEDWAQLDAADPDNQ